MGIFDAFKNNIDNSKLLEKLELKDKTIKRLEENVDSKNKEIEKLKEEIERLKGEKPEKPVTNNTFVSSPVKEKTIDTNNINEMRERLVNKIKEKTKMKSFLIDYEEIHDGDIFISKFGGLGYWDNSKEYPKDKDGNQLILLAQINFDKDKFDTPDLPKSGMLQFYISNDDLYGMDNNGYKVIYHEKVNYDIKKEDLNNIKTNLSLGEEEYFPFNGEYKITFLEKEDYINSTNYNFKDVINEVTKEEFDIDVSDTPLYKVFGDGIMDYLSDKFITSDSKLLGYPYFTQTDPRESDRFSDYKILLFQMDSDGPIMWGDSGVGNFFIKENNKYDDVYYTWDCY